MIIVSTRWVPQKESLRDMGLLDHPLGPPPQTVWVSCDVESCQAHGGSQRSDIPNTDVLRQAPKTSVGTFRQHLKRGPSRGLTRKITPSHGNHPSDWWPLSPGRARKKIERSNLQRQVALSQEVPESGGLGKKGVLSDWGQQALSQSLKLQWDLGWQWCQ